MKKMSRGRTAVRKTKTAAGGAKSTQLKTEPTKTVYGSLVTSQVLDVISKTVTAIDKALANERKTTVNLGGLLAKLLRGFSFLSNFQRHSVVKRDNQFQKKLNRQTVFTEICDASNTSP